MLKKAICLAITWLIFLCGLSYGADPSFPFLAEITADHVSLRAGQSENFEKITALNKGQSIVVLGKNYSWFKVKLPTDAKCYVHSDFVETANYVDTATGQAGIIKGNNVNVRAGAAINFTALGQMDKGDRIKIRGKKNGWYLIEPNDKTFGWVLEKYVAFKSKNIPVSDSDTVVALEPERVAVVPGRPVPSDTPANPVSAEPVKTDTPPTVEEKIAEPVKVSELEAIPAPVEEKPVLNSRITVVGKIEPVNGEAPKGIYYQLGVDADTVYYLQGRKSMLDGFRFYKVKVTGKVKANKKASRYPILNVSKIKLVL